MSLVRLLPAWLHAVADYAVGLLLIVLAIVIGGSSSAIATGVVVGATVVGLSMFTRYPLGVFKVVPFTLHSAGDYVASALLIAAPFALGFSSSDTALSVIYVGAGVAVLAVSAITNYQYRPAQTPAVVNVESALAALSTDGSTSGAVRPPRPLVAPGRKAVIR